MTKRALCVGINNYPGNDNDLLGAVPDANDWGQALKHRGFQVTTILDSQAKKNKIVNNINNLIQLSKKNDIAVFAFSGHGTWIPDRNHDEIDGKDECLCSWDTLTTGVVISDDELAIMFSRIKPGVKFTFISDSCHSGTLTREFVPVIKNGKAKYLPGAKFLKPKELKKAAAYVDKPVIKKAIVNKCLLLSGCKDNEYSWDAYINGKYNGAFSRTALDCLNQNPKTYRKWYELIMQHFPSEEYPQTPQIVGEEYMKNWSIFA